MTGPTISAAQIIAFRWRANALDRRLPSSTGSLRHIVHAGLQDSMPRAAVASIAARMEPTPIDVLDDPALVQVWGPGFSAYVVAAADAAVFTLGRMPTGGKRRTAAHALAPRIGAVLDATPRRYRDVADELGVHHHQLRYAALTGTIRLHWAGAGAPDISALPEPAIDEVAARAELVRRFLARYGPASASDFADWAGVNRTHARAAFDAVEPETIEVDTPIGPGRLLAADEEALRSEAPDAGRAVRLLPSGDPFTLWTGPQRELLVADADRRAAVWTPRVWPGTVVAGAAIVGTWRRAGSRVTIDCWRQPSGELRAAIHTEAARLPLAEQPLDLEYRWE